jgi:hypothetical protein
MKGKGEDAPSFRFPACKLSQSLGASARRTDRRARGISAVDSWLAFGKDAHAAVVFSFVVICSMSEGVHIMH